MAMMAKMRSLAPVFIITVGVLFVLFMIISDSNVLEAFGGRTQNVGTVNGDNITITEFESYVSRAVENQRNQTGQDVDEEQMEQFRDQVWDAVIQQMLTQQQIEKLGITVTDDEIRDIILGENPPAFLQQNFLDSLGMFNRQAYEQALFDPQNRQALVQAEEFVRQQQLSEKLQNFLAASVTVSENEIKQKFIDNNIKINAEYILVDLNTISDSLVNVTDKDIKKYYDENLDKYKVKAQRKLKYVIFRTQPSADDSSNAIRTLTTVVERAKKDTGDFKNYVDIYSSSPYSRDSISVSQLTPQVIDLFNSASSGDIIGPLFTNDGATVYKFYGATSGGETFAKASHILYSTTGDDEKDLKQANEIYNKLLSGYDFATLAKETSQDPGSAANGGDLGWFGKGQMVKEFEDAVFSGQLNVVQKPVKTSYGYHIIKVTGRSNNKYIVEKITNPVQTSATTKDRLFNNADEFSYLANKTGFEKAAEEFQVEVLETTPFDEEVYAVPGLGYNKRIINFAFNNKLNSVSDVFRVPSGYVVVKVAEVIKEGFKNFDEVKETIKPLVLREKKFEKALLIAGDIKKNVGSDFNKAVSVFDRATVSNTGEFTISGVIPNVGKDFAFMHAALNSELNKVTEPVKGVKGYYLIKVTSRTDFDKAAFELQRNSIMSNILQEKRSNIFNSWLQAVKKEAKIVDNRHLFYR